MNEASACLHRGRINYIFHQTPTLCRRTIKELVMCDAHLKTNKWEIETYPRPCDCLGNFPSCKSLLILPVVSHPLPGGIEAVFVLLGLLLTALFNIGLKFKSILALCAFLKNVQECCTHCTLRRPFPPGQSKWG